MNDLTLQQMEKLGISKWMNEKEREKAIEKALDHLFQNAIESMSRQIDKSIRLSLVDANDSKYVYLMQFSTYVIIS